VPIYEYRCKKGHTFEVMQSMSDGPLTKCEVCGASVQRVFHAPAVQFKGSGFYNTDYGTRNRQREKASNESSGSDKAASASSDGGGDSKPADKPAADKPKAEKAASKTD
jgi:putative FmdB family regulatory protein